MKILDIVLLIGLLIAFMGEGYFYFKNKKIINLVFSIFFLLFFIYVVFKMAY